MQKSVLIEIVRSLDKKEIRSVQKWLQSPAHNLRQDVPLLFDYLVRNVTAGDAALEKEEAWKAVFPEQPYDDAYMRQVMYFLLKAIEEYLVFEDFNRDPVQYQLALTRIYRKRKLDKAYKQAHRIGMDKLDQQPLRNGRYLQKRFAFEEEECDRLISINQSGQLPLQAISDALEKWFLAEKLRIALVMLWHKKINQTAHYDMGMLENLLVYANRPEVREEPAIAVYYYACMSITQPENEDYFTNLQDIIHDKSESFDLPESRTLYIAAINYCGAKVNQGKLEYCRHALKFYHRGMENGILLENNLITRYTFGNAVAFAIKIGEYSWAEDFIHRFQHYIEEKQRHSIINFNLSRLYFEKGDYDRAQSLLLQFEYDDMLLNIIAKTMLLKIYYEQDEMDTLESLLESMRIYLQRKEALDPTRKSAYKNLISLTKKLLHHNPYSKSQTERLRGLVETTQPLMERDWLLRQLEPRRRS